MNSNIEPNVSDLENHIDDNLDSCMTRIESLVQPKFDEL